MILGRIPDECTSQSLSGLDMLHLSPLYHIDHKRGEAIGAICPLLLQMVASISLVLGQD